MKFFLDDIAVQNPQVMLQTCKDHNFDTSSWVGKANSFVDRLGVDPSYGYFLVDYATITAVTTIKDHITQGSSGDLPTIPSGAYKLTLTIQFDSTVPRSSTDVPLPGRVYEDMYLDELTSITPSWDGTKSYYLIKLVDARWVFSHPEASNLGKACDIHYWNKVITYLTPEELKETYNLDNLSTKGKFIYEEGSCFNTDVGDIEFDVLQVGKPGIPKPLSWKNLFKEIIGLHARDGFSGNSGRKFPFFEASNQFGIFEQPQIKGKPVYPKHIPQNITNKHRSIRDVLETLLFYCNLTLRYDGKGIFTLLPIVNKTIGSGSTQTTDLDSYLLETNKSGFIDKIFTDTTMTDVSKPSSIELMQPILPGESFDTDQEEYKRLTADFLPETGSLIGSVGLRQVKVLAPFVFFGERDITPSPGGSTFPDEETYEKILEHFLEEVPKYFLQINHNTVSYAGFKDLVPSSFIERISWASLGDTPFTQIETVVGKDFESMKPPIRVPTENIFSIIIARCDDDVAQDTNTFGFHAAKVITGFRPKEGKGVAVNYFNQSFGKNERVILCFGNPIGFVKDEDTITDKWTTFQDGIKFCRLRIPVNKIPVAISSGPFLVPIDDVEVVNGEKPEKIDDDAETEEDEEIVSLTIKNDPRVNPSGGYVYFMFDDTAGDDITKKWSTADTANFTPILRGYPDFGGTEEAPKFLGYDGSIRWIESTGGGGGDTGGLNITEVNEVIQLIQDNTSTTSPTKMLRALVNSTAGVKSTDTTFNFKNATPFVGNSTVTTGSADNDFFQPFVNNEVVLLMQKANGMWGAIKIGFHILLGTVAAAVDDSDTVFSVTVNQTLLGSSTLPANDPVNAYNYPGLQWDQGEKVYLIRGNLQYWVPFKLQAGPKILLGTTTSSVGEDDTTITLTDNLHKVSGVPPTFPLAVRNLFKFNIPAGGWVEAKYSVTAFTGNGPLHWYASQAECEVAP